MAETKIEWADRVWNPITGCSRVSPACDHCYAERMSKRLAGRYGYPADEPFRVTLHNDKLREPVGWKWSSRVFVCSMGDLFHPDVRADWLYEVFATMVEAPQHTFMLLTKRPDCMEATLRDLSFWSCVEGTCQRRYYEATGSDPSMWLAVHGPLPNVWIGTTVEDQERADERMPALLNTPAAKRFVSCEPLLGPVDLSRWLRIAWQCSGCGQYFPDPWQKVCPSRGREDYWTGSHKFNPPQRPGDHTIRQRGPGLDWVICGGETGPGARPMHESWARSLMEQSVKAGAPFFFKQWGEWAPALYDEDDPCCAVCGCTSNEACEGGCYWLTDDHPYDRCSNCGKVRFHEWPDGTCSYRVGKKAAGHLLEGWEHREIPGGA